jgi:tetratricopeptide (TPR) repeat protein
MKKLITLIYALLIGTMSFAQKNEIKAIEKALKSNNFAVAKTNVIAAESLLANMDDKTKDKFYFLKAKSLFSNGAIANTDVDPALQAVDNLIVLKEKTGKSKYITEAISIKNRILESLVQSAYAAAKQGSSESAGDKFYRAYTLSPKDTLYLYAAASSYLNAQKYDKSLEYYKTLQDLKYQGVSTQFVAVNKETGTEEIFNSKQLRDIAVKSKKYISPKDKNLPSKQGEILRYMALIYSNQEKADKALELIAEAKKFNPEDPQLVIAEAKAYLASDQKDKIKPLLESANGLIEGNALNNLYFGIFAMEISENDMAMKYLEEAAKLDPSMSEPHLNIGALILDADADIVNEMNGLGNSSADNERYDVLKDKRLELYKKAIPFVEKAFSLNPDISTAKYLRDIYSTAFMTDKYKEMKQKIADMEAGN